MKQVERAIRHFIWSALHTDPQFPAWSRAK